MPYTTHGHWYGPGEPTQPGPRARANCFGLGGCPECLAQAGLPPLPQQESQPAEHDPRLELQAAVKVLRCPHRYPVQVLTDAEVEQLVGTGRPLADCLDCGTREDGQDVAVPLRENLAGLLEAEADAWPTGPARTSTEPAARRRRAALQFARTILGGGR